MATLSLRFNEDGSAEVSVDGAPALNMTFNQWQNQIRKSALEVSPRLEFDPVAFPDEDADDLPHPP